MTANSIGLFLGEVRGDGYRCVGVRRWTSHCTHIRSDLMSDNHERILVDDGI